MLLRLVLLLQVLPHTRFTNTVEGPQQGHEALPQIRSILTITRQNLRLLQLVPVLLHGIFITTKRLIPNPIPSPSPLLDRNRKNGSLGDAI